LGESAQPRPRDPLARLLEFGLAGLVILAPLPFGAVGPAGRLTLECACFALGLLWLARALTRPTPLPSTPVLAGLVGLLALAAFQALPLGAGVVGGLSPESMAIREAAVPEADALVAETRILGVDPRSLDPRPALSVDPASTASALRTGVAMVTALFVAFSVAALRGVRLLAFGLLLSGSFQGLYGLLVLTSGHDRIWHLPKLHYLGAATGTFINKNHFACFVAMTLACGMALILDNARRHRSSGAGPTLVKLFSNDRSRNLILLLLLVVGLAGMLLSLSRGGITVGLVALLVTILAASRVGGLRLRAAVALLVLAAAAIPLVQVGADPLVERYSGSANDLTKSGARLAVWRDTVSIAGAFPAVGSGYGTFAMVYPVFRSPEVRLRFVHAHNDVLQVLAEGGAIGLLLLALVSGPVVAAMLRTFVGDKGTLAIGFAAGLSAILLHALIDFSFHIPANAVTACVLAGALLGLPWQRRS